MPGFQIGKYYKCPDSASTTGKGPPPYRTYNSPTSNVETARKHRFLLKLMKTAPDNGSPNDVFGKTNDITVFAYKCTRPSPEVDEIVVHHGQTEIYRPGKHRWKPIDITFYEVLNATADERGIRSDRAAEAIYNWWSKTMVVLSESRHNKPSTYLAYGVLTMLDGFGRVVWEYRLLDCWPMKITPSDVDFSDSSLADITLTLRFQKAVENPYLGR